MKVPQFMPFVGKEEYEAIKHCFDINWITEGPKAKDFNQKLCALIGVEYGVFAPNGTLALYLALRALNIGPEDEVIVPDFTFIASANAIQMTGARPVFVDVDNEDLQIKVSDCERVLSRQTKAIMPVHIYGFTSNMDEVMHFARMHDLLIVEDAAQALGIKWKGKPCGSFGHTAGFSFFADKTLTTAEGGFVTTNDRDIHERLLYLRNQGRIDRGTFIHPKIGYNFRMTDLQMAIGLAQLRKFPLIVEMKQRIHRLYCEGLSEIADVEILTPRKEISPFIPFRVVLRTINEPSKKLMFHLEEQGIESRTFFYPLHQQPCFQQWSHDPRNDPSNFKNSTHAFEYGVCLPSFAALTDDQVLYVCDTIAAYFRR